MPQNEEHIDFRCSQCGILLRAKDEDKGKKARCPKCDGVIVVPEHETADEYSSDEGEAN